MAEKSAVKSDGEVGATQSAQTVAMTRDGDGPAPHTADVHTDEVDTWRMSGWRVAEG